MAQKASVHDDNVIDYLVKSKMLFHKELAKRIDIGNELLQRPINNEKEFNKLNINHSAWHDFNEELIRRAFSRPNSRYYKDYALIIKAPNYSALFPPSLKDRVTFAHKNIVKRLLRLKKIQEKLVLIDEMPRSPDLKDYNFKYLNKVFANFHQVAQSLMIRHNDRMTLEIKDEYDVQDLLRSLLKVQFDDIRSEEFSPSVAGGNSRIDFVLKREKIAIEVKMTNSRLKDKEIGTQLLTDIGRYGGHPDCKILIIFIYDKDNYIKNKAGLKGDLEKKSSNDLKIAVFINPK